jgi:hypothetical protein
MNYNIMKDTARAFILFALVLLMASCSQAPAPDPQGPCWIDDDRRDIPEPEYRDPNLIWTTVDRSVFEQFEQFFDLERSFRTLFGNREEAHNINSFDHVPNSSWFTNRIGFSEVKPEDILAGIQTTPGPDTSGIWKVFRPKIQGATPGFWIEDARGDEYIIKFDPDGFPEMATASAAMASRYFYFCGYNVPQETIVHWHPDNLVIKEGATIKAPNGEKREFTREDLDHILSLIQREPDGSIRSLASLSLGKYGKIKGPFSYLGRRPDDPNDWFSHQHRRELRALYVIASFINHYDAKGQNSLDVYVEDDGNRYLKHYLIDFGSAFGSDGRSPKHPIKGYANSIDLKDAIITWFTLGIKTWSWEYAGDIKYPSIGYFEADLFEPDNFDPIYPNPAFENKTARDCFWGARIVMAWRDKHLRALIKTGQYSNPEAEEYLFQTLKKRRDKIGRHWFKKVNPLDNFELSHQQEGITITFDDLGSKYELWPDDAMYEYSIIHNDQVVIDSRRSKTREIRLDSDDLTLLTGLQNKSNNADGRYFTLDIRTSRYSDNRSKPVRLTLWYFPDRHEFKLVGVEHLN